MALNAQRLPALDATRGLAILLMVLSGVIPYGALPAWMYHAQIPPPEHNFNPNLPGFTWVDLVFPLFIFCMGVAIPIALKSKNSLSFLGKALYLTTRTLLLAVFAIIIQHLRPHQIEANPSTQTWLIALLGFLLLFLCFSTYPFSIPQRLKSYLRIFSWLCLALLLSQLTYRNEEGFSLGRSDIIIMVLANVYFFGAVIYLATKNKLFLKIVFALFLLGIRLLDTNTEWIENITAHNPLSWLFQLKFLQYLFIAIPGIIVGEMVLKKQVEAVSLAYRERLSLIFSCSILSVITIVLLQVRLLLPLLLVVTLSNMLVIYFLSRKYRGTLVFQLYLLASILLFTGLLAEPFEGGIKKDPSTLSYYFISAGISCYIFLIFHLLKSEYYQQPFLKLIVNNGKNPMIAYVAFANLLWPLLALTGMELWLIKITSEPWVGFFRGLAYTFIIAMLVSFLTRKGYFWKT